MIVSTIDVHLRLLPTLTYVCIASDTQLSQLDLARPLLKHPYTYADSSRVSLFQATARAGCPDGFTICSGRCYHAVATTHTYSAAEQYCSGMGAILATPRTAAENECAKDVANAVVSGGVFWIGYRGGNTADSFVGADGGTMNFSNWYPSAGEPDLDYTDNCVYLHSGNGLWADYGCQSTRPVLCQTQN